MNNSVPRLSRQILPALVTPLNSNGELDLASAEQLIDHLYRQGVGGLYVTGSTGEGLYLEANARRRIVELAVNMSRGRGKVVVHVGAIQAPLALELAAHAEKVGADSVSSIPPFVGGYSADEIHTYFAQLCSATGLPVLAYHLPGLTGRDVSLSKMAELIALKGIAGIKFSDHNLYMMQRLLTRFQKHHVAYNGCDEMLALGLLMGAHGGIGTTYNFMPHLVMQVAEHADAGRWQEAVLVQQQINEVIEILLSFQGIAATKQILYWQGHIATPVCVSPRAMLDHSSQLELRRRLVETHLAVTLVR